MVFCGSWWLLHRTPVSRAVTRAVFGSGLACVYWRQAHGAGIQAVRNLVHGQGVSKVAYTMTCTSLFGIDVRIAGKLSYPNGSNIQSR